MAEWALMAGLAVFGRIGCYAAWRFRSRAGRIMDIGGRVRPDHASNSAFAHSDNVQYGNWDFVDNDADRYTSCAFWFDLRCL